MLTRRAWQHKHHTIFSCDLLLVWLLWEHSLVLQLWEVSHDLWTTRSSSAAAPWHVASEQPELILSQLLYVLFTQDTSGWGHCAFITSYNDDCWCPHKPWL